LNLAAIEVNHRGVKFSGGESLHERSRRMSSAWLVR
jgi:hypothetical protein